MTRYLLVNAENINRIDIMNSLKKGNFYCAKKFNREGPDPSISEIHFEQNKLSIKGKEKFTKLDIIGKHGNLLHSSMGKSLDEYEMKPEDLYARVVIYSLSGILLSNPMFYEN